MSKPGGRPYRKKFLMDNRQLNTWIEAADYEDLQLIAKRQRMSLSGVAREAILLYIAKESRREQATGEAK